MCRCDSGCCGEAKLEAFGTSTYGAKPRDIEALVESQASPQAETGEVESHG